MVKTANITSQNQEGSQVGRLSEMSFQSPPWKHPSLRYLDPGLKLEGTQGPSKSVRLSGLVKTWGGGVAEIEDNAFSK